MRSTLLTGLKFLYKFLKNITEIICGILLFIMIVNIVIGVFSRYVLGSSLPWVPELTRYFMIWLSMIGAALALDRGEHVSVSFFYEKFPGKLKLVFDIIKFLIIIVFSYVLISSGLEFADTISRGSFTRIPGFYPRISLPIGGTLILTFLIIKQLIVCLEVDN